ncbi:hypothetical protein PCC7424_2337 [Gloeothece citriformis PCC 7424]|uniref:Uncharacterized protein n=1 Tax=Gloeothece citriformis (strain PCC 7424) TaxID=65393 RepID=B7KIS2_GLOC7|nr:hypothetical protein [Gloeothece citriformis]ACK70758.1 hypothetical protein PCC7424_2337 [Gloeothece citriformis PCC 7424]
MLTDDLLKNNTLQDRIENVVRYAPSGLTIGELSAILAEHINQVHPICQLLIKHGKLVYDSYSHKLKHPYSKPNVRKTFKQNSKFLTLNKKELLPGCPSHWSLRQCFKHLGYQHHLLDSLTIAESLNPQKNLN